MFFGFGVIFESLCVSFVEFVSAEFDFCEFFDFVMLFYHIELFQKAKYL